MKDKVSNIVVAFFAIAFYHVLITCSKKFFTTEKVYLDVETEIFHSTPYCRAIEDLMIFEETGDVTGTLEKKWSECYNDLSMKMCTYCYSPMEVTDRKQHLSKIINNKKEK